MDSEKKLKYYLALINEIPKHQTLPLTKTRITKILSQKNKVYTLKFVKQCIKEQCLIPNGTKKISSTERKIYKLNTQKIRQQIENNTFFKHQILPYITNYYYGGKLLKIIN